MSIKTCAQCTIPAVVVDRLQFSQVNITVSKTAPYRIAFTATVHPYGIDEGGNHVYSGKEHKIAISDVKTYIETLEGQQQIDAQAAFAEVESGLGKLAELKLGINFESIE
jgi:hypothetical protein